MGYQEIFKSLLLRHMDIDKLGISGKLNNVLFSTENNGFGIELTVHVDGRNRVVRIPSPFFIEHHPADKLIYLDYRIKTIFNHPRWNEVVTTIQRKKENPETPPSKFYDSIIEIVYR